MMDAMRSFGLWAAVSWPGGSWQNTVKVVLAALITYLLVLWVLMVWWTFRDIRERTRDPFLQAAAVFVVLVFNLPGLWIYLIGRPRETLAEAYARSLEEEALLQELEDLKACPACRRRILDEWVICPICQTQLKEPCGRCSRPLSYAWSACPYCAAPRRGAAVAAVGAGTTAERPAPLRPAEPPPVASLDGETPTTVTRRPLRPAGRPAAALSAAPAPVPESEPLDRT
jgi:RNA polymerase subunit RPABC4/transcription elongation factor Spt4